jgi:transcriptional regulator with XRE-family HTH domain
VCQYSHRWDCRQLNAIFSDVVRAGIGGCDGDFPHPGLPVDANDLQRRFGAAVRRRRLEVRLGQEKLADLAGLHRTHISLLERGGRMPTLGVIAKLAAALGTTMADLLAEVEAEGPPPSEPPAIPHGRPRRRDKGGPKDATAGGA